MTHIIMYIFAFCLLLIVLMFVSNHFFNQYSKRVINDFLGDYKKEEFLLSGDDISNLPHIMKEYLINSKVVDKKYSNYVQLEQRGEIRLKPNGKWMRFSAIQYYRLDQPAFVWIVTIKFFGIPVIRGIDLFNNGKGSMIIKLLPFFTVVNEQGESINEGCHSRFLNEIMWFPHMYTSNMLRYSNETPNSIDVDFSSYGYKTKACLTLNNNQLTNFQCLRWYMADDNDIKRKWETPIKKWKSFNGITLPYSGSAKWSFDNSEFYYIKIELQNIKYF